MKKQKPLVPFDHIDYTTYSMFDDDACTMRETFDPNEPHTLEELQDMAEELSEVIDDWDTLIEDQLNRDLTESERECLKSDRQSRQQAVVELRLVKKQIKEMMNNNEKELIAV